MSYTHACVKYDINATIFNIHVAMKKGVNDY